MKNGLSFLFYSVVSLLVSIAIYIETGAITAIMIFCLLIISKVDNMVISDVLDMLGGIMDRENERSERAIARNDRILEILKGTEGDDE